MELNTGDGGNRCDKQAVIDKLNTMLLEDDQAYSYNGDGTDQSFRLAEFLAGAKRGMDKGVDAITQIFYIIDFDKIRDHPAFKDDFSKAHMVFGRIGNDHIARTMIYILKNVADGVADTYDMDIGCGSPWKDEPNIWTMYLNLVKHRGNEKAEICLRMGQNRVGYTGFANADEMKSKMEGAKFHEGEKQEDFENAYD